MDFAPVSACGFWCKMFRNQRVQWFCQFQEIANAFKNFFNNDFYISQDQGQ